MAEDNTPVSGDSPEVSIELLSRIAQLTRMLRENMRELGLDQAIQDAADAIPDARDRLHYVARMTEQAANRVLNAAEQMQPLQADMQHNARALSQRWDAWFEKPTELSDARLLVDDARTFLSDVPGKTEESLNTLMEIIMAQDFQDLTGQVIMKMLGVICAIETELVQDLIDNVPQEQSDVTDSLLNGPQIKPEAADDVVADQDQVDDLLSSLGF